MMRLLQFLCLVGILWGEPCLATRRIPIPVDGTQKMISNLIVSHTVRDLLRALKPQSPTLMIAPKEEAERTYHPPFLRKMTPVETSILPTLRGRFVKDSVKSRLELGQWAIDLGVTTPDRYMAYVESLIPSHKAPPNFFSDLRCGSFFAYHLQVYGLYGTSLLTYQRIASNVMSYQKHGVLPRGVMIGGVILLQNPPLDPSLWEEWQRPELMYWMENGMKESER
jgi:hypothetical protein